MEAKRPRISDPIPMEEAPSKQLPKPTSSAPAEKGTLYQSIDTFSWEQTHDEVKVRSTVPGHSTLLSNLQTHLNMITICDFCIESLLALGCVLVAIA